jgi:hypothetical protein
MSPETRQWESFLANVHDSATPSDVDPSSEQSRDPSSDEDYCPSPVPKAVLYQPAGLSSNEENKDFVHAGGELAVKL